MTPTRFSASNITSISPKALGLGALLALGAMVHPATSLACSYLEPGLYAVNFPGEEDVATNAAIHVQLYVGQGSYDDPAFTLTQAGIEEPIALEVQEIGEGTFVDLMVSPTGGFEPESDYSFEVRYSEESDQVFASQAFTTGIGADIDAPEAIDGLVYEAHFVPKSGRNDPCPGDESSFIAFDFSSSATSSDVIYEMQVSSTSDFSDAGTEFTTQSYATFDVTELGIGQGDKAYIRARKLDYAQNTGPWTEAEETDIPRCAIAGSAPTGIMSYLFMGLAMVVGGRRRESTPP